MLQHCQVAGPDQRTEGAAAVGAKSSFAPDVVHGEESEAVAVSGLSSLLAEKTVGPSNACEAIPSSSLQMTSRVW